jgi:hypothetical protein
MSNTPNQSPTTVQANREPTTVQDVLDELDDFLTKMRTLPVENDFDLGYTRAINEVEHRLLEALPEGCSLRYTSPSNPPDQMLKIAQDVVDCTSEAFWKVNSYPLESEFQLGYEEALNDLAYSVLPRASRDEMFEKAFQELAAQGLVYDTGERRWSERTQSHQVVWAATAKAEALIKARKSPPSAQWT